MEGFRKISLPEMDAVKFMTRTDTKFIFNEMRLDEILKELKSHYALLEIKSVFLQNYITLYFDSPSLTFYRDHHNKKPHRFKVRMRNYVNSNISFLEIKEKIRGRTKKSRISVPSIEHPIENFEAFLMEKLNSCQNYGFT